MCNKLALMDVWGSAVLTNHFAVEAEQRLRIALPYKENTDTSAQGLQNVAEALAGDLGEFGFLR